VKVDGSSSTPSSQFRWAPDSSFPRLSASAHRWIRAYATAKHLKRFLQTATTTSTQTFTWRAGQISWQGVDGSGTLIDSYSYSGTDVPLPVDERVHLNLWLFNGAAPTNGQPVDVAVSSFSYAP
jgi:hypothetical protein